MRNLDIGVVTDEVSRDLRESLNYCRDWGISRIELREGSKARFPKFTDEELDLLDEARREGFRITAVSPGIFKAHVDSGSDIRKELENALPASIELALRFECPIIISFGFERYDGEPQSNRLLAMNILERAAEKAWAEGLILAVENEPDFWVDDAAAEAAMFEEIGHPGLKANWDPANSHWGGRLPTREGFDALRQHIVNLHVKDFTPDDPNVPWRPVGRGKTPWADYLQWVSDDTDLEHITIETHAPPLVENTRESLAALKKLVSKGEAG